MSNLELNKGDQFIIGLDISASMGQADCPGGSRRIDYVMEQVRTVISEAQKFDPDGVSIYPFGASVYAYTDTKAEEVEARLGKHVKSLEGMTMTHLAIDRAFQEHKAKKSEQTFLLLFTDGEPSNPDAVKNAIINITNQVKDPAEFRIAFLTVGNRSAALDAYLISLDDTLTKEGAKHDIVDVKRTEEVDFFAAISGALVD